MLVSKIVMDATIPFQIKPWEYGEMKNSDRKVNIEAFLDVKKQYLGGRVYSPIHVNNNRNESSNMILNPAPDPWRGALLRIIVGGVPPGSPNPDPISDLKMSFSTPVCILYPVRSPQSAVRVLYLVHVLYPVRIFQSAFYT